MIRTDACSEQELSKAFAWITRNGMGPKFGSRPIVSYQKHQCAVLDVLRAHLGGHGEVRVIKGVVLGSRPGMPEGAVLKDGKSWIGLGPVGLIYDLADQRARR